MYIMKRSIFLISVFLLILAGIYSACKEKEEDTREVYSIKEGRFDLNENEFVAMRILTEEGTNNSSSILRIENHTEKTLQYGREYSLEYLNGNNWESIPLRDVLWELIGLGLSADETTEDKIYLLSMVKAYNNGKKGRYRLTKDFSLRVGSPLGEVTSAFFLSPEFEIR